MRLRVAKKVAKRHEQGAEYHQSVLDAATRRLGITHEPLRGHTYLERCGTPVEEVVDYASMTTTELKALAKERGLKGYSKLKKADIIALLVQP